MPWYTVGFGKYGKEIVFIQALNYWASLAIMAFGWQLEIYVLVS